MPSLNSTVQLVPAPPVLKRALIQLGLHQEEAPEVVSPGEESGRPRWTRDWMLGDLTNPLLENTEHFGSPCSNCIVPDRLGTLNTRGSEARRELLNAQERQQKQKSQHSRRPSPDHVPLCPDCPFPSFSPMQNDLHSSL